MTALKWTLIVVAVFCSVCCIHTGAQAIPTTRTPNDTSPVHCWMAETNSYVSCGPGFTFTLGDPPGVDLRVGESTSFSALLQVTDEFVGQHGGEVSGLHLGALRAKICRGLALLCHPRRSDGGLSHDSGGPATVSRDGTTFTFTYSIKMVR
jgi:hypothetical protein